MRQVYLGSAWLLLFICLTGCSSMAQIRSVQPENFRPVSIMGQETDRQLPIQPVAFSATDKERKTILLPDEDRKLIIQREVIYSASLRMVVTHLTESLRKVQEIAAQFDGYMQEVGNQKIIIRIPANHFQETIQIIEKLGEVIDREIKGLDVTEEIKDLELRLKNAEAIRDRLLTILEKCTKIEDSIKIEKEIERIMETIELLKGKINFQTHNVAFSTIQVEFNKKSVAPIARVRLPFAWVEELNLNHLLDYHPNTQYSGSRSGFRMPVPEGFVKLKYAGPNHGLRLVSPDGIILAVSVRKNAEKGTLEFWEKLIHRAIIEREGYAPAGADEFETDGKTKAVTLKFTTEEPGKLYQYHITLFVKGSKVYLVETAGREEAIKKEQEHINKAIRQVSWSLW